METIRTPEPSLLEHLPWDSDHFGFPVVRLKGSDLDGVEARRALQVARDRGIRLVYCAMNPELRFPDALLREFSGRLVDRKVTYETRLEPPEDAASPVPFACSAFPRGSPTAQLVRLGLEAGLYSRFRMDPRIPAEAFRRLYELWIARSASGELADIVLVASPIGVAEDLLGLITVSLAGASGAIGLIAVEERARGHGIGSLLLRHAHGWLRQEGARTVSVVTQLDNRAACRLYEKNGYQPVDNKSIYHFWPQG